MRPKLERGFLAALAVCLPLSALANPAALVLGNEDYEAIRDVRGADNLRDLREALTDAGFALRVATDATGPQTDRALVGFEGDIVPGDGAVVYLAGRFVHSATETYFLSTGADGRSLEALRREGIPLSTLTAMLAASPGRALLALGDGGGFDVDQPLLESGVGNLAVPQGVTVLVGSPEEVRAVVVAAVGGEAVLGADALSGTDVAASGFLPSDGRIVFADPASPAAAAPDPREAEIAYWEAVRNIGTVEAYETYLDRYPRGIYAAEADERIADLADAPRRAAEATEAALGLSRDQRREIQRALTLLEYNPRGIDGIFGPGTRGAVTAFQAAEGFVETGYLTREQIRLLDRLARARAEELEEVARAKAERAAEADRAFWRDTGASGREEDLRRYLDRYRGGIFAEDARAELRAIEEIRRPEVSATEQLTWQQVEENGSKGAYEEYLRRYPEGAYAESARDEIARLEEEEARGADREAAERQEDAMGLSATTRRTIEQRLDALGYEPGRIDGDFDERTRNALRRYQEDRRLPATGYMNDATMVRVLADTVISIFE
ncbi:MAG: peptidoglycan-binding protein [Paracoccaceae bacterium]|nr:peptidoglycan-binding protein [Paracoccaceae bacterium]